MAEDVLSIAIAQIEPVVGDVEGNVARIRAARSDVARAGGDLAVFCELTIAGYPPEDLVQKPAFQRACREAVEALKADTEDGGPAMLVGAPLREGDALFNAAIFLDAGEIKAIRYKRRLPNFGVFDEPRHFTPSPNPDEPVDFRGVSLGVVICEDMWTPDAGRALKEAGAEILIVPNGSPFRRSAVDERAHAAAICAKESGLPIVYVNQLAGQDEVLFEGASFVMNAEGAVTHRAPQFSAGVFSTQWRRSPQGWRCEAGPEAEWADGEALDYRAVTMAVREYVDKNRFKGVVIGLSGGVDSALAAAIAVDALGPDRVRCVMMPSKYTSQDSLQDAEECAKALGVAYRVMSIEPGVDAFDKMLAPAFLKLPADTTEENIQSRIRGVLLMALSNKFGDMVLATGNKSEMSVGYATLYGDMNGGYNPLKDLYKTEVYRLCRWRNANHAPDLKGPVRAVIPERIITKAPTAELRADQKDEDSLPPYDVLDAILEALVEGEKAVREIVAEGFDEATVRRIEHLLYVAEYKRRQGPPGPKVTAVNFGRDRRYPITNGWRDR
ncbi:MAG: NAD+ synthase [Pseudomonadota bacterium]